MSLDKPIIAGLKIRSRKAGLPPGSLVYTGKKELEVPSVSMVNYNEEHFQEEKIADLNQFLSKEKLPGLTWISVQGLHDVELIRQLGQHYGLHPLVMEDILNVDQRSKVDEFDNYIFIVLKQMLWSEERKAFVVEQVSIIFGKEFLLSFQLRKNDLFSPIIERLRNDHAKVRHAGCDFLAYTLIDTIVDQYFVVLEKMSERIEEVEDAIIAKPVPQHVKTLYRFKRQMLVFRKAIWPLREAVSHLLRVDPDIISTATAVYLRDVYDHTVQAIDTIETFRDMLAGLLDVYLSILTNRMNEVMKVLTVIATLFIPLTFIASIYGMNFVDMPELHWEYGYPAVLSLMGLVAMSMIIYFKKKKWW